MKDFKTGISWLGLAENESMFIPGKANNAYRTFDRVGDVLERNQETDTRVKGEDHLTDAIIKDINQ